MSVLKTSSGEISGPPDEAGAKLQLEPSPYEQTHMTAPFKDDSKPKPWWELEEVKKWDPPLIRRFEAQGHILIGSIHRIPRCFQTHLPGHTLIGSNRRLLRRFPLRHMTSIRLSTPTPLREVLLNEQ
jgi:hypothetical protein